MDDDDQSAAEAHQMELEQRHREEELLLARGRRLAAQLRDETRQFEIDMQHLHERIRLLQTGTRK